MNPAKRASLLRQIAGRAALAVLVPLVLFGAVELGLRALDLGYPTGFLLETQVRGQRALVDNPFYGYRFFTPALARNPAPILTSPGKAPDTIRVVVLGESAAQGDPLMQFGLPRLLQCVLNGAAATGRFEVVNAAMTAINSSVIVDIAREMTACRPDVYVLYIGNNEVIGPYGPGHGFHGPARPYPAGPMAGLADRLALGLLSARGADLPVPVQTGFLAVVRIWRCSRSGPCLSAIAACRQCTTFLSATSAPSRISPGTRAHRSSSQRSP